MFQAVSLVSSKTVKNSVSSVTWIAPERGSLSCGPTLFQRTQETLNLLT
jgi:hypothetical protein